MKATLPQATSSRTDDAITSGIAPAANPTEKQRRAGRLPGLDGLRALAVGLVISGHVNFTTAHPSIWVARYTPGPVTGVNVFFVLSGFLITWLLLAEERETGRVSLRNFYIRRAFRILPPAVVYLMAAYIGSRLFSRGMVVSNGDFLRSLLFVRNYFDGSKSTDHFWSLAIEEQFYLIWPLLFLLLRRAWRIRFVALLLILSPVWWMLRPHLFGASTGRSIPFDTHCHYLMAGCLLAMLRETSRGCGLLGSAWLHSWMVALVLMLIIFFSGLPAAAPISFVTEAALPILVGLLINYVIDDHGSAISNFLNCMPMVWIGRLSYSLYLWQQLFCLSTHNPDMWIRSPPQSIVLSLIAAACSFYFVERPSLRLRSRLFRRRQKVSLQSAC